MAHTSASPSPPAHQIDSFLYLLRSDSGRPLFFEYLRTSYSEHHLLFWEQVQQYCAIHGQPYQPSSSMPAMTPLKKAQSINKQYIVPGAPSQINITEQARLRIQSSLSQSQSPLSLFDESERVCIELMKGNYFYSFRDHPDYKEWFKREKKRLGQTRKAAQSHTHTPSHAHNHNKSHGASDASPHPSDGMIDSAGPMMKKRKNAMCAIL